MKTGWSILGFLFLAACFAQAEAVRNGNELALNYSRADAAGKTAIQKELTGRLLTFRYLKITKIDANSASNALPVYTTIEPSTDFIVILHPQGGISGKVAANAAIGDSLAVNGRLERIVPPNTFIMKPAVLRSKDRAAPKGEKELLPEIDPNAVK